MTEFKFEVLLNDRDCKKGGLGTAKVLAGGSDVGKLRAVPRWTQTLKASPAAVVTESIGCPCASGIAWGNRSRHTGEGRNELCGDVYEGGSYLLLSCPP